MKSTFALLAASTAAFATTASAQPLMTYTYADVAYQWTYFNESGYVYRCKTRPLRHPLSDL